jgi:hypothetical protein
MGTHPYPSEAFLVRSLRYRSEKTDPLPERLTKACCLMLRILAVLVALAGLLAYIYFCVIAQCTKADDLVKPGASSAKPALKATDTQDMQYVWVQLMPDEDGKPGGRLVRAIGPENATCPTITQGGSSFRMHERVPAVQAAFPILLCERVLIDNGEARIGSTVLPARATEPNDIIVLGDTGCRMVYYQSQPCRDPEDWPFAKIAQSASRKVAAGRSFILHLGDFHYRENPCIDSSTRCGASPYGDQWATWKEEFFEPAKPLLLAAPWVIMRGNHEDCARAGAGWIFLFALPEQYDRGSACDSKGGMYQISIGTTDETPLRPRILAVMDTADEKNSFSADKNCELYRKLSGGLRADDPEHAKQEVWLALHQPLWGRNMNGEQETGTHYLDKNHLDKNGAPDDDKPLDCIKGKTGSALPVLRERFEMAKDKRIARLVLAGDNHAFQFFWPASGPMPIQMIAGNGGTKLDKLSPLLQPPGTPVLPDDKRDPDASPPEVRPVTSWSIAGSNFVLMQHGFTVMQRLGTLWAATEFDRDGKKLAACRFSEALLPKPSEPTACEALVTQASSK